MKMRLGGRGLTSELLKASLVTSLTATADGYEVRNASCPNSRYKNPIPVFSNAR